MSDKISPKLAFEALARIMAQAGDAEVSVEIFKKAESETDSANTGRRGQSA